MHYKVTKKYTDNPDNPIKVKSGELLKLIEESDADGDWPNWVLCLGENKQGWIPKQILHIQGSTVKVLDDYTAIEHQLEVGDLLVSDFELNGWIWCEKVGSEGSFAWAPLNHLQPK